MNKELLEAAARKYCEEMGVNPDSIVRDDETPVFPGGFNTNSCRAWQNALPKVKRALAMRSALALFDEDEEEEYNTRKLS